jgi:uncharacterized protein YjbI with pentapeptide repeats
VTQPGGQEIIVDHVTPPLADRSPGPPGRPSGDGPRPDLAAELRASRNWRQTSGGASADLTGIDLSGEDLRGVDFRGAPLADANFTNSRLANAQFAWANLGHADFTGATGLLGNQFARADLTGARLPSSVRFGAFDTADEVAQSTGKLLLTLLLVCAYSWLTINSTLDAKLLTDTGASQLPILNAQIPIVNFYALVPVALVGLALVTMLQAQRLWGTVAAAPSALPDGTTMMDRSGAWLLGPWAAERLVPPAERGFLTRLQARLAGLIGWWLAPATVAWFWVRYLHRHDWPVTFIQIVALTVGCTAAIGFLRLAHETLPVSYVPRQAARGAVRRWARLRPYLPTASVAILVPLVLAIASRAAIRGVHPGISSGAPAGGKGESERPALTLQGTVPALEAGIPLLMSHVGMRPVAQLQEAEVSTRLAATIAGDSGAEAKATGARLIGADLRFAAAARAFLALSDLRYADLLGADLKSADLRGSDLSGASLVGALLSNADLRKARANGVLVGDTASTVGTVKNDDALFCSRTSFAAANLRYARMNSGDFREAVFDGALLQGATFGRARVTRATFTGADLDDADFRGAVGLTADQVLAAKHVDALYDSTLLAALRARSPARFVGYDAPAIALEIEDARLSGEVEQDELSPDEQRARDVLMRAAYTGGPATAPTEDEIVAWKRVDATPGKATSVAIPHGCIMTRVKREKAQPANP